MQEVNNIETGQQSAPFVQENNKVETTQTNLVAEKPKQNSFLITLLSILLLLACSIAGFFAYQTQTLVKELTTLKNTTEPTPTATSLPTEAPTATGSAVVTGTENWKTYSNAKIGASIKYPSGWLLKEGSNGVSVDFDTNTLSAKIVEGKQVNYFFNFQLEDVANYNAWSNDVSSKKLSPIKIGEKSFERIIVADMFYTINYIFKTDDGIIIRFYLGPYSENESKTVLDDIVVQILSTLKFTS